MKMSYDKEPPVAQIYALAEWLSIDQRPTSA
jgi:hypothetical protein